MGDFWKPTADMFGGLIDKPRMTEKLLLKPPFKYIFDIIMETIKKTGCGNGLYTGQEVNADFYNDRDKKVAYLQKVIKLVELMNGEAVEAKPQKIVAGLEPELTNLMLQEFYKCATSGKSSQPYVNKALGKQSEPEKKEIKKPERPPSAARLKKPEKPAEVPRKIEKEQQDIPPPPEEKPSRPQKPAKQEEYSGKVQALMKEAEEQAVVQKEVEREEPKGKGINLGKLNKKKKNDNTSQKIINSGGELTSKELQLVQSMIQSICQNTAPLGKSIEFIHDDVESMNRQLTAWRKQYNASKAKTQNEMRLTEQALLPIYDKIHEIEEQILDQKSKIQTTKSQILKNDSIIHDLLMSVVTTK